MKLNEYQKEATKTAIYPAQGTPLGLFYLALKLNGEAGELAEHVGKSFRDDNLVEVTSTTNERLMKVDRKIDYNPMSKEKEKLIKKEIGDCLWYLANICEYFDVNMSDVAIQNLEKLKSRQDRGVLGGSGDNR